jgi:hypothetical protein
VKDEFLFLEKRLERRQTLPIPSILCPEKKKYKIQLLLLYLQSKREGEVSFLKEKGE